MTPVEAFYLSQIIYGAIVVFFVIPAVISCGIDVYKLRNKTRKETK